MPLNLVNSAAALLVLLGAWPAQSADVYPHVFTTATDVARIRAAVATDRAFARWADELAERARAARLSDLRPLERKWWEADRAKPWQDTYPQVFHHTWIVPAKWAKVARECAWAGLLRPESTDLSAKARQTLLGLADFTFEFEHYDVGMNYTVWAVQALEAYDILHESFTPAQRQKIDACFQRFLAAVQENDQYWIQHEPGGAVNNHYAWHKLCFVAVGLFYGRRELVEQALDGPKGIDFLMRYGFTDDGLWMEGSIPYQFAATAPLLKAAELLENAGYPRGLYRASADGRTLNGAYDALLALLLPDRTLPTIGDCYGRRPYLGEHPDWESLYRRFRDPRYAWLLRDAPRRSPEALFAGLADLPAAGAPAQFSRLWPEHGYAALRSLEGPEYWTGRGWSLFATYSCNRVHENFDKLSIILFADSHLWLPDCEAAPSAEHAFSAAIQKDLNRQTLCHNTLLVDGRSQSHPSQALDLIEYEALPAVKRLSIGDLAGRLYPGVAQMRTALVRPEYVLDFFQVKAAGPRDLDWLLHVDGVSEKPSAAQPFEPISLPGQSPWTYLVSPQRLDRATTYAETFRHATGRLRVDLFSSNVQEVIGCGFPRDDRPKPDVVAMRILRSRQDEAWYAAVYRSGASIEEPLQLRVTPGELGNWQVELRLAGRSYLHRVPRLTGPVPPADDVHTRDRALLRP